MSTGRSMKFPRKMRLPPWRVWSQSAWEPGLVPKWWTQQPSTSASELALKPSDPEWCMFKRKAEKPLPMMWALSTLNSSPSWMTVP